MINKFQKTKNKLFLHNKFKQFKICKKLCKLDNKFPPCDLWIEYYKINKLSDIIIIKNNRKKKPMFLEV